MPGSPESSSPCIVVAVSRTECEQFQVESAFKDLAVNFFYCQSGTNQPARWAAFLDQMRPEIIVTGWATPAFPPGYLEDAACPVHCICHLTGSVRNLVPRGFFERGGLVTNWGNLAAPMVAEHALLLLLGALRRLPEWRPFMDRPLPKGEANALPIATRTLYGRTISLHGFGQVARQFIRLVAPFNVKVRAYSDGVPADFIQKHGAEPVENLAALFRGADTLVDVEALNPQTRGSVCAQHIESLAPGAVFVNVGRGAVVDQSALVRQAELGAIHLALDVLEVEPLPFDSPLRDVSGALLSPHIAGPTVDKLPDFARNSAANVRRYLAGEPLEQTVSLEIYDRST